MLSFFETSYRRASVDGMQFWSWKFQVAISRTFFDQCMLCKAGYALHINLHLRTPAQQRETSKVCSTLIHIAGTSHQKENLAFQAAEIFDRNTCNRKPEGLESGLNKNVPSAPVFPFSMEVWFSGLYGAHRKQKAPCMKSRSIKGRSQVSNPFGF